MDKAEYQVKLGQLTELVEEQDYEEALNIVQSIDWKRVKSVRTLGMVADVYEANDMLEESREILLLAYKRAPIGKSILTRLIDLDLRLRDSAAATEHYHEYVKVAGNDATKYLLKYKIYRAQNAPIEKQIEALRDYKDREYTERWAFELARLYAKKGMEEECIEECDDIILWFSEGKYVIRAMELKMKYTELTPSQKRKYDQRYETNPELLEQELARKKKKAARAQARKEAAKQAAIAGEKAPEQNQEEAPAEPDKAPEQENLFSGSVNLQERLSQSLRKVIGGIAREDTFENEYSEEEAQALEGLRDYQEVRELEPEKLDSVGSGVSREATVAMPKSVKDEEQAAPGDFPDIDFSAILEQQADQILKDGIESGMNEAAATRETKAEKTVEPAKEPEEAVEEEEVSGDTFDFSKMLEQMADTYAMEESGKQEAERETAEEAPAVYREEPEAVEEEIPEEEEPETAEEEVPEEEAPAVYGEEPEAIEEEIPEEEPEVVEEIIPESEGPENIEEEIPEEEPEAIEEEIPEEEPEVVEEIIPESEGPENIEEEIPEEKAPELIEEAVSPEEPEEAIAEEEPTALFEPEAAESAPEEEAGLAIAAEKEPSGAASAETEEALIPMEEAPEQETAAEEELEPVPVSRTEDDMTLDELIRELSGKLEETDKKESEAEIDLSFLFADDGEKDSDGEQIASELVKETAAEPEKAAKPAPVIDVPLPKVAPKPVPAANVPLPKVAPKSVPAVDVPLPKAEKLPEVPAAKAPEMKAPEAKKPAQPKKPAAARKPAQPKKAPAAKEPVQPAKKAPAAKAPENGVEPDLSAILSSEVAAMVKDKEAAPVKENKDLLTRLEEEAVRTIEHQELKKETPQEKRYRIMNANRQERLTEEQKRLFTYFAKVPGMDEQILDAIQASYKGAGNKTSRRGNIAIMGRKGTGKTRLSEGLVKALCREFEMPAAKVARIQGEDMNDKDVAKVVAKMAGGFLIIEQAGQMNAETVQKLSQSMEFRTDSMILLIEDEKDDMRKLLGRHPELANKIDSLISIPVFTNDELVTFARTYASENGYKMDELAVLALYTIIGNNQSEIEPISIAQVKKIMDAAMKKAGRGGRKISRKVSTSDGKRIMLYEKDFSMK